MRRPVFWKRFGKKIELTVASLVERNGDRKGRERGRERMRKR